MLRLITIEKNSYDVSQNKLLADTIGCQNRPYPQLPRLCANTCSTCSLVLISNIQVSKFEWCLPTVIICQDVWYFALKLLCIWYFTEVGEHLFKMPVVGLPIDDLSYRESLTLKLVCILSPVLSKLIDWSTLSVLPCYLSAWSIILILYYRYWKLSLLVHPDKCPHPSAQEAFVKLNNAFKDLQDPQKVHVLNIIWFAKCHNYLK